jgi:hypothetical protein
MRPPVRSLMYEYTVGEAHNRRPGMRRGSRCTATDALNTCSRLFAFASRAKISNLSANPATSVVQSCGNGKRTDYFESNTIEETKSDTTKRQWGPIQARCERSRQQCTRKVRGEASKRLLVMLQGL